MGDDACAYFGRFLSGTTVIAAIVLSIISSLNCKFLKFYNNSDEPSDRLEPPFEGAFEANVGIFTYEIVRSLNETTTVTDGCVPYEEGITDTEYEVLLTARLCAIIAPVIGFLGLFMSCLDTFCYRLRCGFLFASILYLAACGVQAGTFAVYAEPAFCIEVGQTCDVGISVYLSGTSSALYFLSCVFLCMFPSPKPIFGRRRRKRKDSPESRSDDNVVVQPIIINQKSSRKGGDWEGNEEDDDAFSNDDERREAPISPTKKGASFANRGADKVTDDDFDFEADDSSSHVEYYNPDGTISTK